MKCTMHYVVRDWRGISKDYSEECGKDAKYWVYFKSMQTPWGLALTKEALCIEHAIHVEDFKDFHHKEPINPKLKVML